MVPVLHCFHHSIISSANTSALAGSVDLVKKVKDIIEEKQRHSGNLAQNHHIRPYYETECEGEPQLVV